MNESEILLALAAVAIASVGAFLAGRAGGSASTPSSQVPAPAGDAAEEDDDESDTLTPGGGDGWRSKLLGDWSTLLTTVTTIAAALGTYQLTKQLGSGDLTKEQFAAVVAGALAFAIGVAAVVLVPISVRTGSKVTIADGVELQRRINRRRFWTPWRVYSIVPPSSLFGYPDIEKFEEAHAAVVDTIRDYWENDEEPPPEELAKLDFFNDQRKRIQASVGTVWLKEASGAAAGRLSVGVALAVVGFTIAAMVTSQGVRQAALADAETEHGMTVADDATEHEQAMETKVLDDALAEPGVGEVLPAVGKRVTVTFPNKRVAARATYLAKRSLTNGCIQNRSGTVLSVGDPPRRIVEMNERRFIFVVLPGTRSCVATSAWIAEDWMTPEAGEDPGASDGS